MMRRVEIVMVAFVAGLVVAIVLGMSSARVRRHDAEPGDKGPNRMQLSPKEKSKTLRFAFAAGVVAS